MKKLLYVLLVAVLLTGSVAYARQGDDDPAGDDHGQNSGNDNGSVSANQELNGRERITSPNDIKNYRDIIKRGKDLFGFRISSELEKISSPSEIKNFEGVKRIGNALWGHRRGGKWTMVSPEAKVCVAAAITKKDSAIKAALNTFTDSSETAIDARTACQIAVLNGDSATTQMKANMTCKANYEASMKTAVKTMGEARNASWKTYTTELKACNPNAEIKIEDGGNLEDSIK